MKTDLQFNVGSRFLKPFKGRWFSLFVCFLSVTCFFCCQESIAANVQLDGVIQDIIYKADGTESGNYKYAFQLFLFGDKWECKTTYGEYAEVLAFDGTNTYTQHYYPPPKTGAVQQVNTAEITTGEIRKGSSCIDGVPPTRVLWVAYCAKAFFDGGNASPIISPWGHPSLLGADSITYTAEWLDSQHMIPRTLRFNMSYDFWKKELKTKSRDENEPNPFKDNELMGEYNVSLFTNTAGMVLPTEFEVVRYAINNRQKAVVLERFLGKVLAVRITENAWELPPLHMMTQVQDFRFSSSTQPWLHVSYKTPQGQWPGTNDPLVTEGLNAAVTNYARFERKLYQSNKPVTDPRKRGIALLVTLVVLLIPPLVYLLVLVVKKTSSKVKKSSLTIK